MDRQPCGVGFGRASNGFSVSGRSLLTRWVSKPTEPFRVFRALGFLGDYLYLGIVK